MTYTTLYTYSVKRRKTGKLEVVNTHYTTKSLTPMHERLRKEHAGSKTYEGGKLYTNLVPGIPLDKPIIQGGKLVGES